MSEHATLTFVSWLRRGIGTRIEIADDPAASVTRVSVPIGITFNESLRAEAPLALHGPGDVIGFDARAVIRTWPARDATDAEPIRFPLIEFEQVDLPWRYTPARENDRGRLRPWMCLLALREDEIQRFTPVSRERPFPSVTIRAGTPLPRVDQSWAWAHVQVSGVNAVDEATLARLLDTEPHRVIARLLCPRRLDPKTRYWAILVPTFEHGRRAGLRLPFEGADNALTPAWTNDGAELTLPVYHRWQFATGTRGDFEYLVRRLEPRTLPSTVGLRSIDVSRPGAGLPAVATGPLGVEGALKAPSTVSTDWPAPERDVFVARLGAVLNTPADVRDAGGTPVVAPPLYGQWHAKRERLQVGGSPPWFHELNADPRSRVASGLGTQVIQAQQRQLMASAWDQAGQLREVNDHLRHLQLAREVSLRLHERYLAAESAEDALFFTRSLHARVRTSPTTVRARLRTSPIPAGLVSSQWQRVRRPLGPIGRRQARIDRPSAKILSRVNRAEISAAPRPRVSENLVTHERIGARLVPPGTDGRTPARLRSVTRGLLFGALALAIAAVVLALVGQPLVAIAVGGVASAAIGAAVVVRRRRVEIERRLPLVKGNPNSAHVEAAPKQPRFVAWDPAFGERPASEPSPTADGEDSPSARAFRDAAIAASRKRNTAPRPGPTLRSVDLEALRAKVVTALSPQETVAATLRDRLRLPPGRNWQPVDPVEPILAGPVFRQPMYRPLAELSQEWLVPGLEQVAPDSVTLALTNPPFIEAFMVGLNHEMSRELLWNEYPTDQRGTYFRQFWDVAGYVPPSGEADPDTLADIAPIHQWRAAARLGENSPRPVPLDGTDLVLLIRGEVLRRYPRTVVYAARARREDGVRVLGDEERTPVFRARLEPDIGLYGFDLSARETRGTDGGEGWFFVLQEQPAEPQFGLDEAPSRPPDPPMAWQDLSWGHLVAPGQDISSIGYIDLDADQPDTSRITGDTSGARWHAERGIGPAGSRAADLAYITLQNPVRVAIHATDMLPPEATP